jgi:hypothetical protein
MNRYVCHNRRDPALGDIISGVRVSFCVYTDVYRILSQKHARAPHRYYTTFYGDEILLEENEVLAQEGRLHERIVNRTDM